jgi:hypothetical protein
VSFCRPLGAVSVIGHVLAEGTNHGDAAVKLTCVE